MTSCDTSCHNGRMSSRIYLSLLKPEALSPELQFILTSAIQKQHAGVIVAPVWAQRAAAMLRGSGLSLGVTVGFPHGTAKPTLKAIEATSSIKDGADEVFISAHLVHLVSGDYDATRAELLEVVRAARATRRDVGIHVIVETALLLALGPGRSDKAVENACRAVRESGCDGVVTASGFHPAGGTSSAAITALKQHAVGLTITAMGGVPNGSVAEAMIATGADRAVIHPA
jgi:deoxyribose-phosphate aldolase